MKILYTNFHLGDGGGRVPCGDRIRALLRLGRPGAGAPRAVEELVGGEVERGDFW